MPGASVAVLPPPAASTPSSRKASLAPERKYKCQFCNRAFSRSEHRSRHERSHTKERPFKCMKCRSTFVRRDLLLRHDRTVHAKDGGVPLHSDGKRRAGPKTRAIGGTPKSSITLDTSTLEQMEAGGDGIFDVEAAAMLVADLHNKATAAMRGDDGSYEDGASMAFSPRSSTAMEPAVTYPSGAIALPQVQWDNFMAEPKPHSITSSASGSFESSRMQHHAGQLPPFNGRNTNGLVPALQSMMNSLPAPGSEVPAPQSPSAVDSQQAGFRAPQVSGDDERNAILDNIRNSDREHAIPESFRLPGLGSLNRYLATYFGLFHHHLPFLHPASFSPSQVSPPLLLAVLSIGALYAFDQDQAYMLHIGSKVLVNQFLQNKENFSSRKCPLWTMQSSLLNMIFASWSGDPKGPAPCTAAGEACRAPSRVKRSSEMIKVIEECYNCLETAVVQGVRWVARTSSTNWSVEHPLCGLDLMIILTLWLYRLEHDEEPATQEEVAMYYKVRQLFVKDFDENIIANLSSVVARLWGSMLDEVVVWGITRLMGESFKLHSEALVGYVGDEASSNVSTPSMTSQGADEDSVY
ncbi:hypothetical protein M440DRAFT_1335760 [Trichoderma longibrachiatum ATCC 18648]|uniref:C2H2-type domain-containing protein n=1 Tax=Trichoderma longibrachiatum ATCC 18648 TaxID=983965 RepID=A0A2T4C1K9_TRILO|nr:hypothetical protein M440DRAFT_1335760 [Trichoderma longibrachiatum ATCC 18648]